MLGFGRHDEALPHWRDAVRFTLESRRARFDLAIALLLRDDFASGWPLYQERLESPDWTPWATRESIARHRSRALRQGDPPEHEAGKLNLSALAFDAFTPPMSLPHVFATTLDTVPASVPYLVPDPARVAAWRRKPCRV